MPGSLLGTQVRRVEDRELLVGDGTFVDNHRAEGVGHAVFVRSPFAHATLGPIDTSEAEQAPGVLAVYTAQDLGTGGLKSFADVNEQCPRGPLAHDKVRFVGDPIALVIAETRAQAVDAAELVDVDYDDLPVVADVEAAVADDAPLQFEGLGTNVAARRRDKDRSDPFEGADHVVRARMVNQRIATAPIEGNAILVEPGDGDQVTAWVSTQHPHMARDLLADALGRTNDDVRVVTPHVGGAFGGKAGIGTDHAAVALAAVRLGRPVKWTETRSEAMLSMQGRGQVQFAELGLTSEGRIVGLRLRVLGECGAYAGFGGALAVGPTFLMAQGVYDVPELRFDALAVMTNTAPVGAFRGAGRPEAAACIERMMDLAADELGIAPEEIRRRNFIQPDAFPFTTKTGVTYDIGDYDMALTEALRVADVESARAEQRRRIDAGERRLLGIGMAAYVEITGFGGSEYGQVEVHEDGTATVRSGTSSHGQGHATSFSMIASDRLGIPLEDLTYEQSDTAIVPRGGGTGGSRSLQLGGNAVGKASDELREKAVELAAQMLEAAPDDVVLEDGVFSVAGVPDTRVTWKELATYAHQHEGGLGVATTYKLPERDVPLRRARLDRRGRHRHRPGAPAAARRGRRLRSHPQPADRLRAAARRCDPGHLPGAVGGDGLRRPGDAADRDVRRLRAADRGRRHHPRDQQHRDPDAGEPARRQGHRRVRDDRLHARGAERRRRRAQPPRRQARRPAVHPGAGLAGHQRGLPRALARAAGRLRRGAGE